MDRITLLNGVVYLSRRLNKEYPKCFHDWDMKRLKVYVEELELEFAKTKCRCKHEHITRNGADIR